MSTNLPPSNLHLFGKHESGDSMQETVPCVAVKLEDGVGVTIPKLKPVLGVEEEVKNEQT